MNKLDEQKIECPYCGETITVLLDYSVPRQNYIEDCQVCCRPITFNVEEIDNGEWEVSVSHENE